MALQVREVKGRRFVLVPEAEYRRLRRLATGNAGEGVELPALPQPNARGNYPALEYIRASIAREIIQERQALGLTQQELADRAGLRQETVSRIESGKHSPTVRTVEKIDRALKEAARGETRRSSPQLPNLSKEKAH